MANCFNQIVNDKTDLKELKADNELSKTLISLVKEKIKPEYVEIIAKIKLESDLSNGIEVIKKTLDLKDKAEVTYISAPLYRIKIVSEDYKSAESILKKIQENLNDLAKKNKLKFELIR